MLLCMEAIILLLNYGVNALFICQALKHINLAHEHPQTSDQVLEQKATGKIVVRHCRGIDSYPQQELIQCYVAVYRHF